MSAYMESVFQIIRHGRNTNSYKFALLRALAALAGKSDSASLSISRRRLAEFFVQTYWPLEVKYHLRQGTDPAKDPVVMRKIRSLLAEGYIHHGQSLEDFKKKNPEAYQGLIQFTENNAFIDVIPRFHTVRGIQVQPVLYTFDAQGIQIEPDTLTFLKANTSLLDYLAVAGWVDFNEGFTTAPRLFLKLSGQKPERGQVSRWSNLLHSIQNGKCHYGDHEAIEPEVDHLLPWSYVLEDRTWNLVLSCKCCNQAKSDRLPPAEALNKVIRRNQSILDGSLSVDSVFHRDFAEWKSRDLPTHMRTLYAQALVEKFPLWVQ